MTSVRLFVSFPEELVDRPMIYEIVKQFDVVPNIRRANVEAHSGWVILELVGRTEQRDAADRLPRGSGLHREPHGRRRPRGLMRTTSVFRRVRSARVSESGAAIIEGVARVRRRSGSSGRFQ